jgi:hypothetical protein
MAESSGGLLHRDASPEAVRLLRIWVFGIWTAIVVLDPLPMLSRLPAAVFDPAGIAGAVPPAWRPFLISSGFLWALKLALLGSLALVLVDRSAKAAAVVACALLTLYQGIVRGFGYVDHAEIALLFASYFLAAFAIADSSVAKRAHRAAGVNPSAIPFVAILAALLFSYSFAGVYRVTHAGPAIFRSDSLAHWIVIDTHMLLQPFLSWELDRWVLGHPWAYALLKIGFPLQSLVEILAPFCLVSRAWRRVFLSVMVPFHLLSWALFKILFWENLLLYVLLFDWSHWQRRFAGAGQSRSRRSDPASIVSRA